MDTMQEVGANSGELYIASSNILPLISTQVTEIMEARPYGLLEFISPADLFKCVQQGRYLLWTFVSHGEIKIVIITSIGLFPRKKTFYVHWLGGSDVQKYLTKIVKRMEEFVQLEQCTDVSISGRKGWIRLLAPFGYVPSAHVELVKNTKKLWSH